jgi:DNA-binding transcriptional MerR regulator
VTLSIGELSARTGVKIPTIRYYEQIELLPQTNRDKGNRRRYDDETVQRLRLIRTTRELGFDMEAIRDLLRIGSLPARQQVEAVWITRIQLVAVRQRIAKLEKLQSVLTDAVDGSQSAKTTAERLLLLAHEGISPALPASLR